MTSGRCLHDDMLHAHCGWTVAIGREAHLWYDDRRLSVRSNNWSSVTSSSSSSKSFVLCDASTPSMSMSLTCVYVAGLLSPLCFFSGPNWNSNAIIYECSMPKGHESQVHAKKKKNKCTIWMSDTLFLNSSLTFCSASAMEGESTAAPGSDFCRTPN